VAAGHPADSPHAGLTPAAAPPERPNREPIDLEAWCLRLQQAAQLESERGYGDLQGRQERFSAFISRSLAEAIQDPAAMPPADGLQQLARAFLTYGEQQPARRRQLVANLRRQLHAWRCQVRVVQPQAPPRLRLAEPVAAGRGSGAEARLQPDTPLLQLPGVGTRTATLLAGLGLLVARDLLAHYPRDYLDYAHLVRIAALEPGRTATVVAQVRRCHAFTSPRNPSLSILELQLQDGSGRLRVSRFLAGRRSGSAGWLKAQQRQYPPGATVAVSGLVRDSPYGLSFHDPLIEVLESPGAEVRSAQIGPESFGEGVDGHQAADLR
jgi:ATP-dependent DNA helicase RecG